MLQSYRYTQANEFTTAVMGENKGKRG
jgi:hypothetical protein